MLLLGEAKQPEHQYLYHEFIQAGSRSYTARSVRAGDWKAVQSSKGNKKKSLQPIELYNLKSDLGETTNLAQKHPEILSKMERFMDEAHVPLDQVR